MRCAVNRILAIRPNNLINKSLAFIVMSTFSERYGYVSPQAILIKEDMPQEVVNAVCSCLDDLRANYDANMHYNYSCLERNVWRYFLNNKSSDFSTYYLNKVLSSYVASTEHPWYKKLDLLEFVIKYMMNESAENNNLNGITFCKHFATSLNQEFERLHYGYRIVDGKVAPITDEMEIEAIEKALAESKDNVRVHLSEALKLFSDKEHPDFRNSIKESISAVEALCRELTGEGTLGKALKRLEDNGITLQSQLKEALTKLYAYTNQPDTGIRHSLMDDDATYHPSYNEAYFMLVACSAFVNYLRGVVSVKE